MSKREKLQQIARFLKVLSRTFPSSTLDTLIFCGRSICFSTFGEDIVLTRMFRLPATGFYLDVGAHHPIHASNTFRLDLLGWQGLAVEPNPDLAKTFSRLRPNCSVATCGVGATESTMQYIQFTSYWDQCNTFDEGMAAVAKKRGAREQARTSVAVRPLCKILDQYASGRHIDVMSIDVEGLDLQALDSNDWTRWQPSIILVEDHLPTGSHFHESEIANYLGNVGYCIVARVHYTSFFVRRDQVEILVT